MYEEYSLKQHADGTWSYNAPPADDLREALRLCQAHRDRLLADNTKLQIDLRGMRGELEQERAARRDLLRRYCELTNAVESYDKIAHDPAFPLPNLSSPGPAVPSSVPAADVPHDYPQGPGDSFKLTLADIPEHMRTREWIESEIAKNDSPGVHTYTVCECGRGIARSNWCNHCWRELWNEVMK